MKHIHIIALLSAFAFASCTKETGRPDTDKVDCDTVSYTKHIVPFVVANCAKSGCHDAASKQGGTVYPQDLKARADQGRIRARVLEGNPSFMPADKGKLPTKQLKMIECWLNAGAPLN